MSTVESIFKTPVAYVADRSKAVVPVLFLFCVFFILLALRVLKSSCALCPRVSSFIFAFIPRLGKRELVRVLLVHLFV